MILSAVVVKVDDVIQIPSTDIENYPETSEAVLCTVEEVISVGTFKYQFRVKDSTDVEYLTKRYDLAADIDTVEIEGDRRFLFDWKGSDFFGGRKLLKPIKSED